MSRPISFQEKFKDRIGVIGKEGVVGLVKQTDNQIQNSKTTGEINGNKLNEWSDLYNKNQKNNITNNLAMNGNMVINNNKNFNNNFPNQPNMMNNPPINTLMQPNPLINQQYNYIPPTNPYQAYPVNVMPNYMFGGVSPMPLYGNQMIPPQYNQYPTQNYFPSAIQNFNMNGPQYPQSLPFNKQNSIPQYGNFPVKVLGNNLNSENENNNEKNVLNMNNRERLKQKNDANKSNIQEKAQQRSYSSKSKYENKNNSNLNNSNMREKYSSIERAQNTHPDSFSNNYNGNNKSINENDITYHPYTLKDYKELASAKIVLGGLGPNTGTKEWEEKMKKMKKITEYSEHVKNAKNIHLKALKETPVDIIEREKKEKIEASTRNKANEYGKKIKKIKVKKYQNDMIYDYSPYSNNNLNKIHNDDLVNLDNSKILQSDNKIKNELNEFNEIQKKREYLAQQVNAFKDDILK